MSGWLSVVLMKLRIWLFRVLKKGLSLSRNLALVSFLLVRVFFICCLRHLFRMLIRLCLLLRITSLILAVDSVRFAEVGRSMSCVASFSVISFLA